MQATSKYNDSWKEQHQCRGMATIFIDFELKYSQSLMSYTAGRLDARKQTQSHGACAMQATSMYNDSWKEQHQCRGMATTFIVFERKYSQSLLLYTAGRLAARKQTQSHGACAMQATSKYNDSWMENHHCRGMATIFIVLERKYSQSLMSYTAGRLDALKQGHRVMEPVQCKPPRSIMIHGRNNINAEVWQ